MSLKERYPIVYEQIEVKKGVFVQKRGLETSYNYPLTLEIEDSVYALGYALNYNEKVIDYVDKIEHLIDAMCK